MNGTEVEALLKRTRLKTEHPAVELPFLDGRLHVVFDPNAIPWPQVVRAVANLGGLPAAFLVDLEQQIYRLYCQDIEDGSGDFQTAQDQLDWEAAHSAAHAREFPHAKAATCAAEVWPLIRFQNIIVSIDRSDRLVATVTGWTAWDGEHGIDLVFENGRRLLGVTHHGHSV